MKSTKQNLPISGIISPLKIVNFKSDSEISEGQQSRIRVIDCSSVSNQLADSSQQVSPIKTMRKMSYLELDQRQDYPTNACSICNQQGNLIQICNCEKLCHSHCIKQSIQIKRMQSQNNEDLTCRICKTNYRLIRSDKFTISLLAKKTIQNKVLCQCIVILFIGLTLTASFYWLSYTILQESIIFSLIMIISLLIILQLLLLAYFCLETMQLLTVSSWDVIDIKESINHQLMLHEDLDTLEPTTTRLKVETQQIMGTEIS